MPQVVFPHKQLIRLAQSPRFVLPIEGGAWTERSLVLNIAVAVRLFCLNSVALAAVTHSAGR